MRRLGGRHPRKTLVNFCLLLTALLATFLCVHVFSHSKATVQTSHTLPQPLGGTQSGWGPAAWKTPLAVRESASFQRSPYNAANKRRLSAGGDLSAQPKVISWQASRTLRVMSTTSDMFQGCPVPTCQVWPSSKSLPRAHAVVYDDGRMNKQTPPQLSDHRVLVYYDMRTASEVYFKAKGDLFSPYWKSAINWVWSYRLSSDIFEPFAYLRKAPVTIQMKKNVDDAMRRKTKLVVWLDPKINRKEDSLEDVDKNFHKGHSQTGVEDYTRELKKVATMDTLDIISLQAQRTEGGARHDLLLSKYYFILAFEWVHCQYYVSDLFFYAFDPKVMAIPVVRGAVNYTGLFPKDTFIDADQFESPKALAMYLQTVASSPKVYQRMLLTKSQHVREEGVKHAWCQLCDMLHSLPQEPTLQQRYEDIHAWGREHGKCVVSNSSQEDQPALTRSFME